MADPNIAMSRTESPATQSFHTVCTVKDYVRSRRQSVREAFVPLHHPPGHAQVGFGEAVVKVGGRREKVAFFCLILPHSKAMSLSLLKFVGQASLVDDAMLPS